MSVHSLIQRSRLSVPACLLFLALAPSTAHAQLQIEKGDFTAKFGFEGQMWADWQQDQNTTLPQGYAQNLYLRRVRFMLGGTLFKNVSYFFETDQPNLGKSPKALNSGFLVQDAFLEYKVSNAFRIDGGLMFVPFARHAMQSTVAYYSLDISPIATVNNTVTQSSGLRDLGFQARGFLAKDHFLYRIGLFDGARDASGRNSLRTAGFVQWDFFDSETGYILPGTALGKQKILAVNAGFDTQGSYRAISANVTADIPVNKGDEIGGQMQYIHYDGQQKFTTIPDQNDFLAEIAYYSKRIKTQPFFKYESENFVLASQIAKDYNKWGGGVNYYVFGQALKFTGQIQRVIPRNTPNKPSNEFSVQMQVFYF